MPATLASTSIRPRCGAVCDRRVDGRLVADVALDVRHALGDGRLDVEAEDGVAQVAEQLGGGVADAGGGAGDDDDALAVGDQSGRRTATRTCSSSSATSSNVEVMTALTIGQLAERSGVATSAIRFYEAAA